MDEPIGAEIGGAESRKRSKAVTLLLGAVLVGVLIGIVIWVAKPKGPAIPRRPQGVPYVEQDRLTLSVLEFKVAERIVICTLDLPKRNFNGSWYALESDPETRLWAAYGGMEYPALHIQVCPLPMPDDSPIDRLAITGFLPKTHQPPDPSTQPIKVGLQMGGHFYRKQSPVRLIVLGAEKVSK